MSNPTSQAVTARSILADPQRALAEADAHERAGRFAEAETIYRVLLSRFGNQPVILHNLALVRKARGDLDESETLLRQAIAAAPNEAAFHNNLANLQRLKNEHAQAIESYTRAVALKPDYPEAYYNKGVTHQEMGDIKDAFEAFRRAVSINPSYVQARTRIAAMLGSQGLLEDATRELEAALALVPDYFDANYYYGLYLSMQDRDEEALPIMERALSLKSNSAEALAILAGIANKRSDSATARGYAERALAQIPGHLGATIALARADIAERKFGAAEHQLRSLLSRGGLNNNDLAIISGLLADALDGLGKPAEAFAAYTTENETLREIYAHKFVTGAATESARRIGAFVAASVASDWICPSEEHLPVGAPRMHVFLMGFLRSGTTLLEQALAAHPDVRALEERDLLSSASNEFLGTEAGMQQMLSLSDTDFRSYREAYWDRVQLEGLDPAGKVFIDKLPLNTMSLPLLAKLFPRAKVLFALRDPRDVVLSCFRRHFDINVATFEMLTLEGAANLYDAAMAIAEASYDRLPLQTHRVRHEDLVENFEPEMHKICKFIGIDWSPEMRDFGARAKDLPLRSLSAAQIQKGLNREGVGQWQRYAENLTPIMPILRPWVEKFGYVNESGPP